MKKLTLLLALLSLIPASRVLAQWSSDPMVNLGVAVKPNDQVQPKIRPIQPNSWSTLLADTSGQLV